MNDNIAQAFRCELFKRLIVENNLMFPNNLYDVRDVACICKFNALSVLNHLKSIKFEEKFIKSWNNDNYFCIQSDNCEYGFTRNTNMNVRAYTILDDNDKIFIHVKADMLPYINNEEDFYSIINHICSNPVFLISFIHESCHLFQILTYGKDFYKKCNSYFKFDQNNGFLEIEAYTQQAINLNGNSKIKFKDLINWVENLNDGMLKQMEETILNNKEVIEQLFKNDTFKVEESKNPILSKFSGGLYFRSREEVEKELDDPNSVIIRDDF